tara:strand:- start:1840 stop:2955 length:1116 start_codon:yes stop_codon:yes gene_type:complete
MNKLIYVSDISFPNTSAQAIQILKMCDEFSNKYKVHLLINNNTQSFKSIKKNYNLKSIFYIKQLSNDRNINFFKRINLAMNAFNYFKKIGDDKTIIFSRSIIASMVFSFFGIKNFLEIHHQNSGLTNIIFKLFRLTKYCNKQYYVLIHKNLNSHFKFKKEKFIVLDDGVDLKDFKHVQKKNKIKLSCVYTGSFYRGKGIEFILKLSKLLPNINFYLYGDISTLNKQNLISIPKNVFFKNYVAYNKIPSILSRFKIILMPYSEKVYVKSNSVEVGKYMSPLKLFDYLASGKTLLASRHENYRHLLKDNYNCYLLNINKIENWQRLIQKTFFEKSFNKKLLKINVNAVNTAKKYTWKIRVNKLLKFFKKKQYV